MKRFFLLLAFICLTVPVCQAQSDEEDFDDEAPLPPDLPAPIGSEDTIEPDVTIIRTEKELIEEYRLNGLLYMIKITPKVGKPYYLIDQDGDGQMEGKISDIYNTPRVPQWVLFSW